MPDPGFWRHESFMVIQIAACCSGIVQFFLPSRPKKIKLSLNQPKALRLARKAWYPRCAICFPIQCARASHQKHPGRTNLGFNEKSSETMDKSARAHHTAASLDQRGLHRSRPIGQNADLRSASHPLSRLDCSRAFGYIQPTWAL